MRSIHFQIHYNTQFGQELRVVGNLFELGNWKPDLALKMVWKQVNIIFINKKDNHWEAKLNLSNSIDFEYKYVLCQKDQCIWENGENRLFIQKKSNDILLKDTWEHQTVKIHVLTDSESILDKICLSSTRFQNTCNVLYKFKHHGGFKYYRDFLIPLTTLNEVF